MDAGEIARLYASVYGIPLGWTGAETLAAATGGWPAALLLLQYNLQPRTEAAVLERLSRAGEPGHGIYEYLLREALNGLPPDVERFLGESSLLPELEPALCDEILERRDSAAVLEFLSDSGLFTYRLAAPTLRYAYHPLFGQVLRNRHLTREPDACRRLLARAATTFARRGETRIALDCYLNAGDFPAAASLLLEMIHAEAHPPLRTVTAWMPRFPAGMLRDDPALLVVLSYLQFRGGNAAEAAQLCSQARLLARRHEPAARTRVLLAVARLLRYELQDLEAADAVLAEVEPLLPASEPLTRAGVAMLRSELNHGRVEQQAADLRSAARLFAACGNKMEQRRALLYEATALIHLGRLHEASEALAEWRPGQPCATLDAAFACFLQMCVFFRRGETAQARDLLPVLLAAAAEFDDAALTRIAASQQLRIELNLDDLAAAESTLAQLEAAPGSRSPTESYHLRHLRSELCLLQGETAAALTAAEAAYNRGLKAARLLQADGWRGQWALAVSAMAAGQRGRALALLRAPRHYPTTYSRWAFHLAASYLGLRSDLLTLADLDQELHAVVELGAPERYGLLPHHPEMEGVVFAACHERGLATAYVREALRRLAPAAAAPAPERAGVLSLRERAVLGLLMQGLTNQEIAGRLQVAEGTVKAHTHRIFTKLVVRNRAELVARSAGGGRLYEA